MLLRGDEVAANARETLEEIELQGQGCRPGAYGRKQQFVDPDFPPDNSSVGNAQCRKQLTSQWKVWMSRDCRECRVSGIGYRLSGIGYRVSGIGYRVLGVGYRVSSIGYRISGIGHRGSGIGYRGSGSGIGYEVSGARYRVSGIGYWVYDIEYKVSSIGYRV